MSDADTNYPPDNFPEFLPDSAPVPEYNIVTAFSEADLECLVTARMAAGWTPQGGLQVTMDRYTHCDGRQEVTWHFHQAVRK